MAGECTTRDNRTELFIPSKQGEYGDNWRALEHWARVKWQDLIPINGWTVGSPKPQFATDGFGNLLFRGHVNGSIDIASLPFFITPPGATPQGSLNFPTTVLPSGFSSIPGGVTVLNGKCYAYFTLPTPSLPAPVYGMVQSITSQTVPNFVSNYSQIAFGGVPSHKVKINWDAVNSDWEVTELPESRYLVTGQVKISFITDGTFTVHLYKGMSANTKALTSNIVTLTLVSPHCAAVQDSVTITGMGAPFDGEYIVLTVPTALTLTYSKVAANVAPTATSGSVNLLIDDFHGRRTGSGVLSAKVSAPVMAYFGNWFFMDMLQQTGSDAFIEPGQTWFGVDRISSPGDYNPINVANDVVVSLNMGPMPL